jgi:hypothetical protein
MMIVTQINDSTDVFTLAHEDKVGAIMPISDFQSKGQAELLKDLINQTGFCIKLKELSTEREFSIGRYQKNQFIECKTADSLEDALSLIGINVNFPVEAPEFDLDSYQPQYH